VSAPGPRDGGFHNEGALCEMGCLVLSAGCRARIGLRLHFCKNRPQARFLKILTISTKLLQLVKRRGGFVRDLHPVLSRRARIKSGEMLCISCET